MAVLALSASARSSSPGDVITELRTYVSRDAIHPGETFKVAARLAIGPGWHINANPASDELLIPTSMEFAAEPLPFHVIDIVYPEATMVRLGFSDSDVAVYSESALIGALVKADASLKPGTYALKGKVTFQACNDVSCLPPESRDFEMAIVVVDPGRETHDIDTGVFGVMKFGPDTAGS
jgi:DsbC/DsbD-like thiol-disulfide interchange protein